MDRLAFLAAMHLSDSFFPTGAFTLSHGLESMVTDGMVGDAEGLRALLVAQLLDKMALSDLPALLEAHHGAARGDLGRVIDVDHALTAVKLAREDRESSCRTGRRLAVEASRLVQDPFLDSFLSAAEAGRTPANGAVALALATRPLAIGPKEAALLCCYMHSATVVGAALRLMRIGHGQAQAVLFSLGPQMLEAAEVAGTIDWRDLVPCLPQLDIACARHERAAARLFAS